MAVIAIRTPQSSLSSDPYLRGSRISDAPSNVFLSRWGQVAIAIFYNMGKFIEACVGAYKELARVTDLND
eukprot:9117643-Lingulodinium_polyedra.AAC.1